MTRRRAGYALVELLVVLTVSAIMLTLCAGLIHLLLKLDRSSRSGSEEAADMARLARDFRGDAHASGPIEPTGGAADRLAFPLDGGRAVEYQVRPFDVLRAVKEGEKPRRFETYRRPPRASIRLEVAKDGPATFATLIVDRPPDSRDDSLYRDHRIEAEVGKDRRLIPRAE